MSTPQTAAAIAAIVEKTIGNFRVPASAIVGQLAGGQVAPAASGTPGVVDLDDVLQDGDTVTYLDFAEGAAPATPAGGKVRIYAKSDGNLYQKDDAGTETSLAGGGGGGAPTDARYVTTAANGTLTNETAIPGLAGILDRAGIGGAGFAREFESGDTAPSWSLSPAAHDVGVTYPSHLYARTTGVGEHFGTWAWTPGTGAFDLTAKIAIAGEVDTVPSGIGLHVQNSDNTVRLLCNISAASVAGNTFASGSYTQRGAATVSPAGGNYTVPQIIWVRILRDGSNNVSFWFSLNGVLWQRLGTISFTITIARVGFRVAAASNPSVYVADWLRSTV